MDAVTKQLSLADKLTLIAALILAVTIGARRLFGEELSVSLINQDNPAIVVEQGLIVEEKHPGSGEFLSPCNLRPRI